MLRNRISLKNIVKDSCVYGSLYVGAEVTQQLYLQKSQSRKRTVDVNVVRNYGVLGYTVMGPTVSVWYQWLDRQFIGRDRQTIVKKLLFDQFVLSPVLLFLFFTGMSILERKESKLETFREKFAKTFAISCLFWLPVQNLNFRLVPPKYRVFFVGTCSFSWANILCWLKRQE